VTDHRFTAEQRLAFGQVAELYDRWRPSYPMAAVDAVIRFGALTPPAQIVEVGAGTGKATALFAERGLRVIALEPSPAMARVARVNCDRYPGVEIVETEFECWDPSEPLSGLVSAAAWHWITPDVRSERAHRALAPGGTLAAMWSLPDWERCSLRQALSDVYRATEPDMRPDFPMHPDSGPAGMVADWQAEVEAGTLFCGPVVMTYPWMQRYRSSEYPQMLRTHQDHILLADDRRRRLLGAIADVIDDAGGVLEMPFITHVCLARRA
jgi:SAM-dependent methyltransferase